jgi:hypothetical protein
MAVEQVYDGALSVSAASVCTALFDCEGQSGSHADVKAADALIDRALHLFPAKQLQKALALVDQVRTWPTGLALPPRLTTPPGSRHLRGRGGEPAHAVSGARVCVPAPLARGLSLVPRLAQVKGHKAGEVHTCLGGHFCSCHAFFYDVVNKSNQLLCKHLVAAQFARVLQRCRTVYVADVVFCSLLEAGVTL